MRCLARSGQVAVLACVLLTSCSHVLEAPRSESTGALTGVTPPRPSPGVVDLTVYLRSGEGAEASLVPVTRAVSVDQDLPRKAVELLCRGPQADDRTDLAPPLPDGVTVRDVEVRDGEATVDLSAAMLAPATQGAAPEDEVLALAALANTLTEFPSVDTVRLLIEGRSGGEIDGYDVGSLWGGWGLPETLVRDESLIGGSAAQREPIVPLDRFSTDAQQVGGPTATPITVRRVQLQERISTLRLVLELADGSGASAAAAASAAPVPPACLEWRDGRLLLEVEEVEAADAAVSRFTSGLLHGSTLQSVDADPTAPTGTLRLVVVPLHDTVQPPAWLHTLAAPTRLVVDLKK